jgi:hypothetical protein
LHGLNPPYRINEPPTTRSTGDLDFSAIGRKREKHGRALDGAGVTRCKSPGLKTTNHQINSIKTHF